MSAQSKPAEFMEEGFPTPNLLARLREGNSEFYAKDVEFFERRKGIVIALNGVIEFLGFLPEARKEHLGVPFAILATALEDLEECIVHPLLAPTKKAGRTPNPTIKKEILGFITAGLEMMFNAKIDKEEAARPQMSLRICSLHLNQMNWPQRNQH